MITVSIVFVLGIVLWAIMWRNSSILYETFSHGPRSGNRLALTFDDGPDPAFTARTLDILSAHGVKATFFCLGNMVAQHPDLVRRMHAEGHLVASHGFDHSLREFFLPPSAAHRSLVQSGAVIRELTGYFPRFYRPPVGVKTPPRLLAAYRLGLTWTGWSRQAVDGGGRILSPARATVLAQTLRPGDILLLHDGRISRTGRLMRDVPAASVEMFAQALQALLSGLRERDLDCVRLDQLANQTPGLPALPVADSQVTSWRLVQARFQALMHERAKPAWMGLSLGTGVLIGCSPFFGLHTFIALVLALRFRLHKLATLAGTAISTPPLTPFLILGCLQSGWWCLHGEPMPMSIATLKAIGMSELLKRFLVCWLVGLPLFGLAVASLAGLAFYAVLARRGRTRHD